MALQCEELDIGGPGGVGFFLEPYPVGPNLNGGDDQGKAFREKQAKQFLQDLADCISDLYKVTLTSFQESQKGVNGVFTGRDARGDIRVVNDVKAFSTFTLRLFLLNFSAVGWAPPSTARDQTNYAVNDADPPEMFRENQIHELAHSLDMITSGSIFGSSEPSAKRLQDCIFAKQASRRK